MSTIDHPSRPSLDKVLFDFLQRIRRIEAIPPRAVFEIKLFADEIWPDAVSTVTVGDGRFILEIGDEQLDGAYLLAAQAYVTTAGTGTTSLMIRNVTQAHDMLNSTLDIGSGELSTCGTLADIDTDNDQVAWCDQIALDIDDAGTGAKGLGVTLTFGGF